MSLLLLDPTTFRANIRIQFARVIGPENVGAAVAAAEDLETGVFNYAIEEANRRKVVKKWKNKVFTQIYIDRLRTVHNHLKITDVVQQIRSRDIPPHTVAFLTHQECKPHHWKELIDRKIRRDASKYMDHQQASTDMYTCSKCKTQRCTYYELQTRSADEPATVFITCLDCGKRWRN